MLISEYRTVAFGPFLQLEIETCLLASSGFANGVWQMEHLYRMTVLRSVIATIGVFSVNRV
jgi:hypothetical protein